MKSLKVSKKDREILRSLAKRMADITADPRQKELLALWRKHNSLQGDKIMVLCGPEGGAFAQTWKKETTHPAVRNWEWIFRYNRYCWENIPADAVFTNSIDIPFQVTGNTWNMQAQKITLEEHDIDVDGVATAYNWVAPLKELDDLKKLRHIPWKVDEKASRERFALAQDLFGDIVEVRQRGYGGLGKDLSYEVAMLRGMEQAMMDMCDNPSFLHELMAFLRDAVIKEWETAEAEGKLTASEAFMEVADDIPKPDFKPDRVRLRDRWGYQSSQEFAHVSPEMFDEFVFRYQMPVLEKFGLASYGCCEPLHHKLDILKRLPNLRRVSVSPWADVKISAEKLGDRYILSWRPNPAIMAMDRFDPAEIRKFLEEGILICRRNHCHLEIWMKDVATVNHQPDRLKIWAQTAQDLATKYR